MNMYSRRGFEMNNKIIVSSLNSINPKYKNEHGYEFNKYEVT